MSARLRWTLLLLPPLLGVGLTVLAARQGWEPLLAKRNHEAVAVPMLGLSLLLWGLAAWRTRVPVVIAVALLGFALLCREIHFEGSDHIILLAVFAGAWWGWRRRALLRQVLRERLEFQVFAAALWAYFVSQSVAQRAFRGVPGERQLHIPIEELVETVGHIVMLSSAVLAVRWARSWRAQPSAGAVPADVLEGESRRLG